MANIFHVERTANKITLGTTGTTINIASHTASRLLALDASKDLESITDLIVDTTNHRVGIGTTTPSLKLDVKGTANTSYTNCPLLMQVHTLDAYAVGMGGGISLGGEYGSVNTTTFGYIAGLKENADEGDYAGKLVFGTRVDGAGAADFTRMTILSTGNVGIGITTPDSTLHVHTASAGSITANALADDLIVENDTDGGISILTPNDTEGRIVFGDPDNNIMGGILYDHNLDMLMLAAGGSAGCDIDGSNISITGVYKIGGTQVVGNRVIDVRCDDAINSGDATTDGVIDSLRDAMITHGLIAAA